MTASRPASFLAPSYERHASLLVLLLAMSLFRSFTTTGLVAGELHAYVHSRQTALMFICRSISHCSGDVWEHPCRPVLTFSVTYSVFPRDDPRRHGYPPHALLGDTEPPRAHLFIAAPFDPDRVGFHRALTKSVNEIVQAVQQHLDDARMSHATLNSLGHRFAQPRSIFEKLWSWDQIVRSPSPLGSYRSRYPQIPVQSRHVDTELDSQPTAPF